MTLIEAGQAYPPDGYPEEFTIDSVIAVEPKDTWGYAGVPGRPPHAIAAFAGRVLSGGSAINDGWPGPTLPAVHEENERFFVPIQTREFPPVRRRIEQARLAGLESRLQTERGVKVGVLPAPDSAFAPA